jgi:hypothetical protein
MLYKLLGMIVWRIGRRVLRRNAANAPVPPALLAGGLVAVLVAVAFALRSRGGD